LHVFDGGVYVDGHRAGGAALEHCGDAGSAHFKDIGGSGSGYRPRPELRHR
jgi:hypothetical protein